MKFASRVHPRTVAALTALAAMLRLTPVGAAPGDIFSASTPVSGADHTAASSVPSGDKAVASQTGAFEYSYPIHVPPGRNGMQPKLTLSYSSQAPIYGTVASGWSLKLPIITRDTAKSRLVYPEAYVSSLAGNRPLVEVNEPTIPDADSAFRAQNDTTWVHYNHMGATSSYRWTAISPDGVTAIYGADDHRGTCAAFTYDNAPITSETDSFNNRVDYFYTQGVVNECLLTSITWGQNAPTGLASFASVSLSYSQTGTCAGIPVGSQSTYRNGNKIVSGASELDSISIAAYPPGLTGSPTHQRLITLSYALTEASCQQSNHAPYRALSSIQETAWGTSSPSVAFPATTFTYGSASVLYSIPTQTPLPWQPLTTGTSAYNVSWGYRFQNNKWPTVEAMMLDVDGDGLLDRVTNMPVKDANGHIVTCRAQWERNLGPGHATFDATPRYIFLPTLKWASNTTAIPPADPNLYSGGNYAQENVTEGADETCSLNYQITGFINSRNDDSYSCHDGTGCIYGPTGDLYCADGDDCDPPHHSAPTYLSYRWTDIDGDGLVDIVAAPSRGGIDVYNFVQGNGYNAGTGFVVPDPEYPLIATTNLWGQCPPSSFSDGTAAYSTCGKMHPWIVYKNRGAGVFGAGQNQYYPTFASTITHEPVALEGESAEASILSTAGGTGQALIDIDGDGYPDEVSAGGGASWGVYRNEPRSVDVVHNRFRPVAEGVSPYSFPLASGQNDSHLIDVYEIDGSGNTSGLFDINGDGLPDRWAGSNQFSASVAFNDGVSFHDPPEDLDLRPSNDGNVSVACVPSEPSCECTTTPDHSCVVGGFVLAGSRTDSSRTIDLDNDGRVDVVRVQDPFSSMVGYFNQGGQFDTNDAAVGLPTAALSRRIEASDQFGLSSSEPYTWELRSDMVDLDGDGIPEALDFGPGRANPGTLHVSRFNVGDQPPRLLTSIDNHQGLATQIRYASVADSSVVTQSTDQMDQTRVMPQAYWVVKSITTADSLAATSAVTGYRYLNPRRTTDPDEWTNALRGFDEIDETSPSGAVTARRYDYSIDWSGRLAQTLVFPAEAPNNPYTIDQTTWVAKSLFNAITTFHPSVEEHFLCGDGQTESMCTSASADGYTRQTETFSGCRPNVICDVNTVDTTAAVAWKKTQSLLDTDDGQDPRAIRTAYFSYQPDPSTVRIRQVFAEKDVLMLVNGVATMFAKSAKSWDPAYLVPLTEEVWVDNDDAHRMITTRAYDMYTGNVIERWKPTRLTSLPGAIYTYDDRRLFVSAETNELGQRAQFSYDYDSGTKIDTLGPNQALCNLSSSCPTGSNLYEETKLVLDGFGRTVEQWQTFGTTSSLLTLYKVRATTFSETDHPTLTSTTAIDLDSGGQPRYASTITTLDGHRRALTKTSITGGPIDAITSYAYRNDGTLMSMRVPNPAANDSSTVEYDYTYDSLKRPTSVLRPDGTGSGRSGQITTYRGSLRTQAEVAGASGGSQAAHAESMDRYGRLASVAELATPITNCTVYPCGSPGNWSVTSYQYGPNDQMTDIVDADGVLTSLVYDFAKQRTQIAAVGGTWSYTYDLDGNIASEQSPCSGLSCSKFTTLISYDPLDRPITKNLAPGNLSAADQTLFGTTEALVYDAAANQLGRLSSWTLQNSTAAILTSAADYDGGGNQTASSMSASIPSSLFTATGSTHTTFNLAGEPVDTDYHDGEVSSDCPDGARSEISYDPRGLPSSIADTQCPNSPINTKTSSITETRNVAGVVTSTSSSSNYGSPALLDTWSYDTLGRVTAQSVVGLSQLVQQTVSYGGTDDPAAMSNLINGSIRTYKYGFDTKHQLLGVKATSGAYTSTYEYSAAGHFLYALTTYPSPKPNNDVLLRNATYVYDHTEHVTSMTNIGGVSHAYTYDAAGNTTQDVASSGDRTTYVYDGKNQLRRVTSKRGATTRIADYWYDGNGQRTVNLEVNSSGHRVSVVWILDGVERHYDAADVLQEVYSNTRLAGVGVMRLGRTASGVTVEHEFHGLGNNTIAVVDEATGRLDASIDYAPYGEIVEATSGGGAESLLTFPRRFNDKYTDAGSNLTYYGHRYYDKILMSWTQADPLYRFAPDSAAQEPRRFGLYDFSLHNPLRYLDPDGLDEKSSDAVAQQQKQIDDAVAEATMILDVARDDPFAIKDLVIGTADDLGFHTYASVERQIYTYGLLAYGGYDLFLVGTRALSMGWEVLDAFGGVGAKQTTADFSAATFDSEKLFNSHFKDHALEWGPISQDGYLMKARSLLSTDVGGDILGGIRKTNGDLLRYNVVTNEFAVGTADGTIRTIFRPTDKLIYWAKQAMGMW